MIYIKFKKYYIVTYFKSKFYSNLTIYSNISYFWITCHSNYIVKYWKTLTIFCFSFGIYFNVLSSKSFLVTLLVCGSQLIGFCNFTLSPYTKKHIICQNILEPTLSYCIRNEINKWIYIYIYIIIFTFYYRQFTVSLIAILS